MERLTYILAILTIFSCSNEKKEGKGTIDAGIDTVENTYISKTQKDSSTETKPANKLTTKVKNVLKGKFPKREFYNNSDKNNKYLAYEWAITFFVKNEQQDRLQDFKQMGFPMEWWASGECSFYPVPVDSVSYFLKIARKNGYKDYGFDCEKVGNPDFNAVLSNSVLLEVNSGFSIDSIISKYNVEFTRKLAGGHYLVKAINLNAKELIAFVEKLNREKGVKMASFKFANCRNIPLN